MVKNLPAMQETWVWSLGWEDPLEKKWQPTPIFLPGEFHGQRSLVGYSSWGLKELDTTERLTHTHQHQILNAENTVAQFPSWGAPYPMQPTLHPSQKIRRGKANIFPTSFETWPYPPGKTQGQSCTGSYSTRVRGRVAPGKHWTCPPGTKRDGLPLPPTVYGTQSKSSKPLCISKRRIIKARLYSLLSFICMYKDEKR